MESENILVEILNQFISGSIAGALSNMVSYPFTNLRLRRITENFNKLETHTHPNETKINDENLSNLQNNKTIIISEQKNIPEKNLNEDSNLGDQEFNFYSNLKSKFKHLRNKNIGIEEINIKNFNPTQIKENISNEYKILENDFEKDPKIKKNLLIRMLKKIYENIDVFKYCFDIIKTEGASVLFDGMSSAVLGGIVQNGVYFCSAKIFSYIFKHYNFKINNGILDSMLINLLSAICTALITNPIWVLNIRMAKRSKEDKNFGNFTMIKKIIKQEGVGGFYKGITPALILTLNPVILFTTYELMRKSFTDVKGNISNKNIFFISFVSKILTILINYPLMTIKSLYQANSHLTSDEVWILLIQLLKEENFIGLYKGLSSKLIGSLISNSILMFSYEKIQKFAKIALNEIILGKKMKLKL